MLRSSPSRKAAAIAYPQYPKKEASGDPVLAGDMPSRAQPIVITPIRNPRTSSVSYRVTGTPRPGGKQHKKIFADLKEAEAQRDDWEFMRTRAIAAIRSRPTSLTAAQLRAAESAMLLLENESLSLIDAVKIALRTKQNADSKHTFAEALKTFLETHGKSVSVAQHANYRTRGESFAAFIGKDRPISEIQASDIRGWLESRGKNGKPIGRKTWNNLRCDLSAIFQWFIKQRWLSLNPVDPIEKFGKRALSSGGPKRLSIATCQELMDYLEKEKPHWCTFFTFTLFLGVRPDMRNGEMAKLAKGVWKNGLAPYFVGTELRLPAEFTKDHRRRSILIPENAQLWLKRYPVFKESLCPGYDKREYAAIRRRFQIPPDGLRHTAISAHVTKFGSLAKAAIEFGNSETIIRSHYLDQMTPAETEMFYAIKPSKKPCAVEKDSTSAVAVP